jgi:hypothetical protein
MSLPRAFRPAIVLSVLLVGLGVALLVRTATVHGQLGYLLGSLFIAAGVLRLYLSR